MITMRTLRLGGSPLDSADDSTDDTATTATTATTETEQATTAALWDEIVLRARDLMERKDADDGASWRLMRVTSLLDRMRTKLERVERLLTAPEQRGAVAESIEDSLTDIINEAVFASLQYHQWRDQRPQLDPGPAPFRQARPVVKTVHDHEGELPLAGSSVNLETQQHAARRAEESEEESEEESNDAANHTESVQSPSGGHGGGE